MTLNPDTELVEELTALVQTVQTAYERCAREHDVSPTLARLLAALRDGMPTMNELAALIDLDKSSTSGLVGRAQRRGLVRRLPSQLDRRSVRVRLTGDGRALQQTLAACLAREVGAMLEPLAAERREALAEALRAILSPR